MKHRLVGWVAGVAMFAASVAQAEPLKLWQVRHAGSGNIYYGGAVKDHQFYTGQITTGPQVWDRAGNLVGSYATNTASKSSVPLGPYVFFSNCEGGVYRINSDWQTDLVGPIDPGPGPETLATDGEHLYTNDDNIRGLIHKYKVSNEEGNFTLAEIWAATTGVARVRGLSYHNGKLYAADYGGTSLIEVDAETGVSTTIITLPANGSYQAVRSGNRIYVVGTDDHLRVYETDGNSWKDAGSHNLGLGDLYGISDVDNDCVWITSYDRNISFWRLEPKRGTIVVEF